MTASNQGYRKFRVLYAPGPGEVIGSYKQWRVGEDDPTEVSVTYSGQFFDACKALDAEGWIVSTKRRKELLRDGRFVVEQRGVPFEQSGPALYHVGQTLRGLFVCWRAWRFRADAVIVAVGCHWFSLLPLVWTGVKVIPALHSVLLLKHRRPTGLRKFIHQLDRMLFRRAAAIVSVSDDVSRQARVASAPAPVPVVLGLAHYRRETFARVAPAPPSDRRPFRVMYAGRIEPSKGVFDLLEIAKRFRKDGIDDVEFDLCGGGGSLEALRGKVAEVGLGATFRCHGHCNRDAMGRMFSESHIVVVPTRSELEEGFNMVLVESILAGRPAVTSDVCPALENVREACIEVRPDDVSGYAAAILQLRDDRVLYEAKRRACAALAEPFYSSEQSWGGAVRRVLRAIRDGAPLRGDGAAGAAVERTAGATARKPA